MEDHFFDMPSQEEIDYTNFRFREFISQTSIPNWICPHCQKGNLQLSKDKLNSIETEKSKKLKDDPDFEPEWISYIFSDFLKCTKCNDLTAVIGNGQVEHCQKISDDDEWEEWLELIFIPKYFYPPIHIFKIPQKTPESARLALIESFSLAWSDFSSAANKLRISIEHLVDKLDNSLTGKIHNKIEQLQKKDQYKEIATMLMAIKWIGNEGSHYQVELKEYDIAFAYKVMEEVLNSLYERKINIKHLSMLVEQNRGSLKKHKI